ncbi:MAG: indole-3-glycerol phosphate synthase TrpC [Planctomycetaceae bacterium]
MSHVLDRIVSQKRIEIEAARGRCPTSEWRKRVADAPAVRDFEGALRAKQPMGLIAEVKKASPSAGLIRADFDPVDIARIYAEHGAACISVLTDEHFFQGHLDYLTAVRGAVEVPVLRKDFILDEYQLLEARGAGADCVLLIAECLNSDELRQLYLGAADLGMQSLIEIYEPANLDRVLALEPQPTLVGVNNRNLQNFVTNLEHCITIRQRVPESVLLVGESGIHTREHVLRLQEAGIHAILVGESLMRSPDIGAQVDAILGR